VKRFEDYFGADDLDRDGRVEAFLKTGRRVERLVRTTYLPGRWKRPGPYSSKTMDVERLLQATSNQGS